MRRPPAAETEIVATTKIRARTTLRTIFISDVRSNCPTSRRRRLIAMRKLAEKCNTGTLVLHSQIRADAMIRIPSSEAMGRITRIALFAVLVLAAFAPRAYAQQDLTFSLFERYLEALRVQANVPGLSAAIVQNERLVWSTGLGFADVEHAVRPRVDTPYHISGLTEMLSSALLLEGCVENNHLSLDDRIERHATQAPDGSITIRDALTHRASDNTFKYDQSRYAFLTGVAESCIQKGVLPFRQALDVRLFERLTMYDSVPAQNVDDESADDRVQFSASQLDRFAR